MPAVPVVASTAWRMNARVPWRFGAPLRTGLEGAFGVSGALETLLGDRFGMVTAREAHLIGFGKSLTRTCSPNWNGYQNDTPLQD